MKKKGRNAVSESKGLRREETERLQPGANLDTIWAIYYTNTLESEGEPYRELPENIDVPDPRLRSLPGPGSPRGYGGGPPRDGRPDLGPGAQLPRLLRQPGLDRLDGPRPDR